MRTLDPNDVDRIVMHCTAGRPDATYEDIRRYHVVAKGWSDIGYHFLIWPDGTVRAARPIWNVGAHAATGGYNSRSIAPAWVGLYEDEPPSRKAWDAAVALAATLSYTYRVPVAGVIGHREVYDEVGARRLKTCPGSAVQLGVFRADVAEARVRMGA